jgi:hypothetical protein
MYSEECHTFIAFIKKSDVKACLKSGITDHKLMAELSIEITISG